MASRGGAIGAVVGGIVGIVLAPYTAGTSWYAYMAAMSVGMAVGMAAGTMIDPPTFDNPTSTFAQPTATTEMQITQNSEGVPVPVVYGTVKIAGTVLWYGTLESTPITQTVQSGGGGGKGGGGGGSTQTEQITGYTYYLHFWKAICMGKVTLGNIYVNEEVVDLTAYYTFNDGTGAYYPTDPGPYATPLKGVAHIFFDRYLLGDNVTRLPIMQFVVTRVLEHTEFDPTTQNMASGSNPAVVIFDLLVESLTLAGISKSMINIPSFQAAATYYLNKGWGINFALTGQKDVFEVIAQIEGLVGCIFGRDIDGLYALRATDPADTSQATMNDEDYEDFTLTRKTWDETYNDFRADFTDPSQAYSARTVQTRNSANIKITGSVRQQKVDFRPFHSAAVASDRLADYMKKTSYPQAELRITTNLKFSYLTLGDIITVNNTDFSMVNVTFRIKNIDISKIDESKISFFCTQTVESMIDGVYQTGGAPQWVKPDFSPAALDYQAVVELPYINGAPRYAVLGARHSGHETGMQVWMSSNGTDYSRYANIRNFAQRGLLTADLPTSAVQYDETSVLIYDPSIDDMDFEDLPFSDLSVSGRLVRVGTELIGFMNYTPVGDGTYRLTNLWRGAMGSTIAPHSAGDEVWIFRTEGTIISPPLADFYVKLLTYTESKMIGLDDATAIHVTSANVTAVPYYFQEPDSVTAVTAVEDSYINTDGTYVPTITLTYTKPAVATFWDHAMILIKTQRDAEYRYYGDDRSGGTGFVIDGSRGNFGVNDTVSIKVISVSSYDVEESALSAPTTSLKIEAVNVIPLAPTGLELVGAAEDNPYVYDSMKFDVTWRSASQSGGWGSLFGEEPQGIGGIGEDPFWLYDEIEVWVAGVLAHTERHKALMYRYIFGDAHDVGIDYYMKQSGGEITIRVRRWTKFNSFSPWSSITLSNPAPATPTGLSAEPVVGGVQFSWAPNTESDLDGYQYRTRLASGAWSTPVITKNNRYFLNLTAADVATYGRNVLMEIEVKAIDVYGNLSGATSITETSDKLSDELFKMDPTLSGGTGNASELFDGVRDSGGIFIA